ncbi:hypothetical protein RJ639_011022 [Escallonia herrerae]|uniref:BED-type domain-containing protein n=1 Tax=Escallonia herrerae TaxID=1293975 RepID=A0AA88VKZ8_9ASTE|nr:hypothetical protein RJ639_011022 [Escallonia herrerae]
MADDMPSSVAETTGGGTSSSLPPKPDKKRSAPASSSIKESPVWEHFDVVNKKGDPNSNPNEPAHAICKYCTKKYLYAGVNGTSTLWTHLNVRCKKYPYNRVNKRQGTLSFEPKKEDNTMGDLKASRFSTEECRLILAEMIIVDELPFNHVEKQGFRKFCHYMQPRFIVPSRIGWSILNSSRLF